MSSKSEVIRSPIELLRLQTSQILQNWRPILRTWIWFLVLIALYFIVEIIPLALAPGQSYKELEVGAAKVDAPSRDELETYLRIHGFDQVKVEQRKPNDGDAEFTLIWTETWSPWTDDDNQVLDRLGPTLEAQSMTEGAYTVVIERSTESFYYVELMLPVALAVVGFLLWQRHAGTYVAASPHGKLGARHFVFAALTSVPLALVLLILFSATNALDDYRATAEELEWKAVITIIFLIPLIEEVIFRGWLLEAWRRLMAPTLALFLSALAFTLLHPMGFAGNTIFLLPGVLWGYLWLRYHSVALCTTAHSSYNAIALTIILHQG